MDTSLHPDLDVRGLSRSEVESRVLEAYRSGHLSDEQMRRLLGLETQFDVHAFLKERGVYLNYSREDLEQDLKFSDSWLSSQTPPR
jgi:predicted HTH domain antitoxin